MTIAIHQPNFIPWCGYFYKISIVDTFVLLDNVQYSKNSFINRNKIKTPQGAQWLTIPVLNGGNFGQLISEVEVLTPSKSLEKIKSSIKMNYGKSRNFKQVFAFIEASLNANYNLAEINESLIRAIIEYLGIKTKIIKSSELNNIEGDSTDRLVSICKTLNADTYLAGFGSVNYQEDEQFKKNNLACKVYDFSHPTYVQLWGEFIPNMSIIDLLFNTNKAPKDIFND